MPDVSPAPAGPPTSRRPAVEGPNAPRLLRERRTIGAMVALYCREQHAPAGVHGAGLCPDCQALQDYAFRRLDRCPYGPEKPTCANCPIHCYQPAMRQRVRVVMRYAGPRMLRQHPLLALLHQWDSWRSRGMQRPPPSRSGKRAVG